MKRKQIFETLAPTINMVIEAQQQGKVGISHKIALPLSKMLNCCIALDKEFQVVKSTMLKKYCSLDAKGEPNVIDKKNDKETVVGRVYDFKDESSEKEYISELSKVLDEDIHFDTNKIPLTELQRTTNFPIIALARLLELDLISELKLV